MAAAGGAAYCWGRIGLARSGQPGGGAGEDAGVGEPGLSFAGLLRQLRSEAKLTQEELAAAARLSPRSVSDLERGINRTAHKDTAVLLAGALGLAEPAGELFVAAARGKAPAAQVLAAARSAGPPPAGAAADSPYRGLRAFEEQDAELFFGREAATAQVLERMSQHVAGPGLLVVSGVSGAGKSSLLRAGVLPRVRACGLAAAPGAASWPCLVFTPTRAPLDELAVRVGLLAGADAAAVRRELEADPAGFALTARQAALARPAGPAVDLAGPARNRDRPPPQQQAVCCWWWISSRSCSPTAPMRGSDGHSSPPCTRPPPPGMGRTRHRRHWPCWACAPTSRPGARTTRSWPARSRTATWSPR